MRLNLVLQTITYHSLIISCIGLSTVMLELREISRTVKQLHEWIILYLLVISIVRHIYFHEVFIKR